MNCNRVATCDKNYCYTTFYIVYRAEKVTGGLLIPSPLLLHHICLYPFSDTDLMEVSHDDFTTHTHVSHLILFNTASKNATTSIKWLDLL